MKHDYPGSTPHEPLHAAIPWQRPDGRAEPLKLLLPGSGPTAKTPPHSPRDISTHLRRVAQAAGYPGPAAPTGITTSPGSLASSQDLRQEITGIRPQVPIRGDGEYTPRHVATANKEGEI
jgi:hypothetical protein